MSLFPKFEEFYIDGEPFEAKIDLSEKIHLSGKYEILVRKKNVGDYGDIAKVEPGVTYVNDKEYSHRHFQVVDSFYRRKGIGSWMFNRLKQVGDILEFECVSDEEKLKEFYISKGYEVVEEIRHKDGRLFSILKLEL